MISMKSRAVSSLQREATLRHRSSKCNGPASGKGGSARRQSALRRANGLAILPRLPEHVGSALAVHETAGHEEIIRKAVHIFQRFRRHALARLVLEFDHEPLRAAADCARKMQIGRSCA